MPVAYTQKFKRQDYEVGSDLGIGNISQSLGMRRKGGPENESLENTDINQPRKKKSYKK